MKAKKRIAISIFLLIAAIAACIYNFALQREILYFSSAVVLCGALLILIKEIMQYRK